MTLLEAVVLPDDVKAGVAEGVARTKALGPDVLADAFAELLTGLSKAIVHAASLTTSGQPTLGHTLYTVCSEIGRKADAVIYNAEVGK